MKESKEQKSFRTAKRLKVRLPTTVSEFLTVENALKPWFRSLGRLVGEVVCRWHCRIDSDAPQRLEHLLQELLLNQSLRNEYGEIDFHRKHQLQDLHDAFKRNVIHHSPRPWQECIAPLAEFYGLSPQDALYAHQKLVTWNEALPEFADFRDEVVRHCINDFLRPHDKRITWSFIVVFVFEGSQRSITHFYVRKRTPVDDSVNFLFEPKQGQDKKSKQPAPSK